MATHFSKLKSTAQVICSPLQILDNGFVALVEAQNESTGLDWAQERVGRSCITRGNEAGRPPLQYNLALLKFMKVLPLPNVLRSQLWRNGFLNCPAFLQEGAIRLLMFAWPSLCEGSENDDYFQHFNEKLLLTGHAIFTTTDKEASKTRAFDLCSDETPLADPYGIIRKYGPDVKKLKIKPLLIRL